MDKDRSLTVIFVSSLVILLAFSPTISSSSDIKSVKETTPPDPITELSATSTGSGSDVELNWTPSNAPDFAHYNIYQNDTDEIKNVTHATLINNSITYNSTHTYMVTGLKCDNTYYFAVTAVDASGNENKNVTGTSTSVTVRNITMDITYPTSGETFSGNITVQVRVNNSAVTPQVNISIDKGQWLECEYIGGLVRRWEHSWDTTLETDGEHTIDATATNKYGVTRNAESITVNVTNQHFTLQFNPGWNLVTLPLNTHYKHAGGLANDVENCTHIGKWDSSAQEFEFYVKKTDANNFTLQNGIGYIVYTNTSSQLVLSGTNITSTTIDLSISWNSIGWYNFTSTKAEDLAQNIINCSAVAYWNVTLGRFVTHPINTDISDFVIERGMGVFVYVKT